MAYSDDDDQVESELEDAKTDLRQDLSQVRQKIQETRAQLSPLILFATNYVAVGVAFALGLLRGYLRVPLLDDIAKPVVPTVLSTEGKGAARRPIRGSKTV
jgi:hypothetical protein